MMEGDIETPYGFFKNIFPIINYTKWFHVIIAKSINILGTMSYG